MPPLFRNDPLFIPYNHMLNLAPHRKQILGGPLQRAPAPPMRRAQPQNSTPDLRRGFAGVTRQPQERASQPNLPKGLEPNVLQKTLRSPSRFEPKRENGRTV